MLPRPLDCGKVVSHCDSHIVLIPRIPLLHRYLAGAVCRRDDHASAATVRCAGLKADELKENEGEE